MRQKQRCSIAGVVLVRQRPGTAKGVVFMTIEDETGVANIVVWKKIMERFRKTVMGARLVRVNGEVQRAGDVIHIVAHTLEDLSGDLELLSEDELPQVIAHADHMKSPLHSRKPPERRERRERRERIKGSVDKQPDFLANADEVKRGSNGEEYLRMSRQQRQAQDKARLKALEPPTILPLEIVTGPGRPKREAGPKRQVTVPGRGNHPRNVRIIPKSRDFH
jgi:DNA polymerase III alpha subunit